MRMCSSFCISLRSLALRNRRCLASLLPMPPCRAAAFFSKLVQSGFVARKRFTQGRAGYGLFAFHAGRLSPMVSRVRWQAVRCLPC